MCCAPWGWTWLLRRRLRRHEAIRNGLDALAETIAALESLGLSVPELRSSGSYSGKFIQRVPRSLHARLAARARQEGVSMNALVTAFLAESLARETPRRA